MPNIKKHTKDRHFRLTAEQDELLIKKATNAGFEENISAYLRFLVLGGLSDIPSIREELHNLNFQISKIGTNINQITKNHNAHFYNASDKENLLQYLKEIIQELEEIKQVLKKE